MPEPCRGGLQYGNRYFKCWKKEGHGYLDLEGAIAQSCDVYFYQLGLRLGLNAILQDGVLLGFRDRSGIDIPNEVSPIFPASTAYYDRLYGRRNWSSAVVLNLAIGQGENTQTLINMVRFYEALASGGKAAAPYVVRPTATDTPGPGPHARPAGRDAAGPDRGGRARHRGGVAHRRPPGGGKTGTAQNPHGKDHGWFIGFAPADKPEIIVGGIMEFAVHGTVVAPYVVRAIRRYLLGAADTSKTRIEIVAPEDSAPRVLDVPRTAGFAPTGHRSSERRRTRPPPPGPERGAHPVRAASSSTRRGRPTCPRWPPHAWQRQIVWSVVGMGLAAVVFRFSPRLLEWIAPMAYGASILLLLITLVVGKGVGTAVSSKSWIVIAGHPIGQPAELAKLAVVLMLARYLSGRREAPQSLRELVAPCLIAGRALPPGGQAAGPGERPGLHRDPLRHAVLGRRPLDLALPAGLAGGQPAAGLHDCQLDHLDGGPVPSCS